MTDELERLSKLHKEGAFTDTEFLRAKSKLLAQPDQQEPLRPQHTLAEAANRYVSFQMAMAAIGVILFLFFLFGVMLPAIQGSRGPTIRFQPSK